VPNAVHRLLPPFAGRTATLAAPRGREDGFREEMAPFLCLRARASTQARLATSKVRIASAQAPRDHHEPACGCPLSISLPKTYEIGATAPCDFLCRSTRSRNTLRPILWALPRATIRSRDGILKPIMIRQGLPKREGDAPRIHSPLVTAQAAHASCRRPPGMRDGPAAAKKFPPPHAKARSHQ